MSRKYMGERPVSVPSTDVRAMIAKKAAEVTARGGEHRVVESDGAVVHYLSPVAGVPLAVRVTIPTSAEEVTIDAGVPTTTAFVQTMTATTVRFTAPWAYLEASRSSAVLGRLAGAVHRALATAEKKITG